MVTWLTGSAWGTRCRRWHRHCHTRGSTYCYTYTRAPQGRITRPFYTPHHVPSLQICRNKWFDVEYHFYFTSETDRFFLYFHQGQSIEFSVYNMFLGFWTCFLSNFRYCMQYTMRFLYCLLFSLCENNSQLYFHRVKIKSVTKHSISRLKMC